VTVSIKIAAPSAGELDIIHSILTGTYWSPGIPRDVVDRAFANSVVALAYEDGALVGFARCITDHATFAWLADVFVLDGYRGKGVARTMVAALMAQRDLTDLRRWMLGTRDAHTVYAPLGFTPLGAPERVMHRIKENPYGLPVG
jgi:GNAT superfamily N-acetyltransferase